MDGYLDKYDKTTITKFDIIGSYFVNLFYNEFYKNAVTIKLSNNTLSTTDAYKNTLVSYLEFIKKPECFKQIVKGIHVYCTSTTKYTTMSHKECVEFMILEFIPQKLRESLREEQKNKLFHETIISCITIFIKKIISNHLNMIIDNHSQENNTVILQNVFLEIILLEKEKIYSKFLNPKANSEMISIDIFKSKITDILNDKKKLKDENANLLKKLSMVKTVGDKSASIITELQTKNKTLYSEVKILKSTIDGLNKVINKLKSQQKPEVHQTSNSSQTIQQDTVLSPKILKKETKKIEKEDENDGSNLLDDSGSDDETLKFDADDDFYES